MGGDGWANCGTWKDPEESKHECHSARVPGGGKGQVPARMGGCAGARDAEAQRWRDVCVTQGQMVHRRELLCTRLLINSSQSLGSRCIVFDVLGIKTYDHQRVTLSVTWMTDQPHLEFPVATKLRAGCQGSGQGCQARSFVLIEP